MKRMTPAIFAKSAVHLGRYQKRDVTGDGIAETWCNYFINDCCVALGIKVFDTKPWPKLANQMVEDMQREPHRWQELDPDEAQAEANRGALVIAGASNPKGSGHVALIIPGALVWSKSFKDDAPNCANVGTSNFYGRPVSYAFKSSMKPRYWMWAGEEEDKR